MADEIFFEVGARISALRGAMKQSEFAERLGVARNTINRWEAGERLPDGSGLLRMREAFGADINVILTGQAGGVAPENRPDEEELLANYRQANSDGRERIRQIAATAANSPKRRPPKDPARVQIGVVHGHQIHVDGNVTGENAFSIGLPSANPVRPPKT